jgi:hypothetical protein
MALESGTYNGAYSFTVASPEIGSLPISFSYTPQMGTRYPAQDGWWSYWTQAVGNAYPLWHAARRNAIGMTQTFLNHLGMGLESAQREFVKFRKNLYVGSADLFQPERAYRLPINKKLRTDIADLEQYNLLLNSDFSLHGPSRYDMPAFWSSRGTATTGTVSSYSANALTGSHCVKMEAAQGEECYLHQSMPAQMGQTTADVQDLWVTGSAWVLIPQPATYEDATGELVLSILYENGTGTVEKTTLPTNTVGAWKRVTVTKQATARIVSVDLMVHVQNDASGTLEVFVDAMQVETGERARPWMPNPASMPWWWDVLPLPPIYLHAIDAGTERSINGVTYTEYPHTRVWVTTAQEDWWDSALPTRVGDLVASVAGYNYTTRNVWGFVAEPDARLRFTTKFVVNSNKVNLVQKLTPADVMYEFQLAEQFLDNDLRTRYAVWEEEDASFSRTIEALTIHRDRLWLVALETYQDTTRRVLKVCRPHSNSYVLADVDLPNYLEVIQDFSLSTASGSCTDMAFVDGQDNLMMLVIDATEYELPLYYDYAYFSGSRINELLLRHEYSGDSLVLS